jgi:hypothetical protein
VRLFLSALLLCHAAQAEQRKTLTMNDQCSVALKGGKIECMVILDSDGTEPKPHPTGKEWDFWFEQIGKLRTLVPQNGTRFAKPAPVEFGKAGCQASAFKSGRLRVDQLPAGSHICVRSASGNYAELILNAELIRDASPRASNDELRFSYILWD